MHLLRNVPIRQKLSIIAMLTAGAALLFACIGFLAYEQVMARRTLVEQMFTAAGIVGYNTAAALSFNDSESARQTLKSLQAMGDVAAAVIYDGHGKPFAGFSPVPGPDGKQVAGFFSRDDTTGGLGSAPPVEPDGHRFGKEALELFRETHFAGETIGAVYLRANLDRLHARLWRYAGVAITVILAAAAVAFGLSVRLVTGVTGPILHLAGVVGTVAAHKDYSVRAIKQNEDELGQLMDGFNDMLSQIQVRDRALQDARDTLEARVEERTQKLQEEIAERKRTEVQLEQTHKELVEASRRGGMAEIATNVLHNVGNVLNSVNVSTNLVTETVKGSRISRLAQLVEVLREHERDLGAFLVGDPRGRTIPTYLAQLSEHLQSDQAAIVRELGVLRKRIDHIMEIVAMQQTYAKVSGVKEAVDVRELVQDSLRMNSGALARHGVTFDCAFDEVPKVVLDKNKLLQILVNLVRNAKYACSESERADKRVTVHVGGHQDRVRISVNDNGVGIPRENLTRIFSHGFTTRKDGHGFGLHSGALAAKELGGSLSAHSDGPGRGATFTLELPAQGIGADA